MKQLLVVLVFVLNLNAEPFGILIDKIIEINGAKKGSEITVKLFVADDKYKNHKLINDLETKLFQNNIITAKKRKEKPKVIIKIVDIKEKHENFWETKYDKYNITYMIIKDEKRFKPTETIVVFHPPSPYSLYVRIFLIFIIISLLYRMHQSFKEQPTFKTLFITYGPALLIIFALIQGYFFSGVI